MEIHIILDNYGTHKTAAVKRWFERHPEDRLDFTPTSGLWLNQVERFFAEITAKRIRRGVFRSVAALEKAILDYLAAHHERPRPFVWTADADLILDRVKRVCERIPNSGHQGNESSDDSSADYKDGVEPLGSLNFREIKRLRQGRWARAWVSTEPNTRNYGFLQECVHRVS